MTPEEVNEVRADARAAIKFIKNTKEPWKVSQIDLLTYCRNKEAGTFSQRFSTWITFVEKDVMSGGSISDPDAPEHIQQQDDTFENRYHTYDIEYFLPAVDEIEENEEKIAALCLKHGVQYFWQLPQAVQDNILVNDPTYIEVGEWMMLNNFGGFTMDW